MVFRASTSFSQEHALSELNQNDIISILQGPTWLWLLTAISCNLARPMSNCTPSDFQSTTSFNAASMFLGVKVFSGNKSVTNSLKTHHIHIWHTLWCGFVHFQRNAYVVTKALNNLVRSKGIALIINNFKAHLKTRLSSKNQIFIHWKLTYHIQIIQNKIKSLLYHVTHYSLVQLNAIGNVWFIIGMTALVILANFPAANYNVIKIAAIPSVRCPNGPGFISTSPDSIKSLCLIDPNDVITTDSLALTHKWTVRCEPSTSIGKQTFSKPSSPLSPNERTCGKLSDRRPNSWAVQYV